VWRIRRAGIPSRTSRVTYRLGAVNQRGLGVQRRDDDERATEGSSSRPARETARLTRARPTLGVAALVLIGAMCVLGVLALPWVVPVRVLPIESVSQMFGFSNRVAVLSAVVGALLLAVVSYRIRTHVDEPFVTTTAGEPGARLSRIAVVLVAAASAVVVIGMGVWLAARPVQDSPYFVDRMLRLVNGNTPYTQFEFSYGPLMLYPQTWLFLGLHRLGVSLNWTYCVWFAGAQALGVVLACYVIDRLAITSRTVKLSLLVALVVVDAPLLSLNQSLFRVMLPYALLLAVLGFARRKGFGLAAAALAVASVVLVALVSPEQGVALLGGMLAAFSVPAWRGRRGAWTALGVVVAGGAVVAAVVLRLPSVAWAATGINNLPVFPGTPELVLLAALLLVAISVGSELDFDDLDRAPLLVGWFAAGLVLLSAAMGHADGMHVFLNGMGFLLGAAAIVSRRRFSVGWIAAGAVGFAIVSYAWGATGLPRSRVVARNDSGFVAELSEVSRVAVVDSLGGQIGEALAFRRAVVPTYANAMYDTNDVRRTLSEATNADYLLVPWDKYRVYGSIAPSSSGYYMHDTPPDYLRTLYGVPVSMKPRHSDLDGSRSLYSGLFAMFAFDRQLGAWTLLKRR
jgi:hypothetical protein